MNDGNMISGYDFILPGTPRDTDIWFALLCVREAWPSAVFHGLSNNPRSVQGVGIVDALSVGPEVFVYRDWTAVSNWTREGATEETSPTMIHILVGKETMTLVADSEDSEAGQICEQIRVAIRTDRLADRV